MTTESIQYRPNLQGIFLDRFYKKIQFFNKDRKIQEIEQVVLQEVKWVEEKCKINVRQRRIYRAIWYLLRDLLRAGWTYRLNCGVLEVLPPSKDFTPKSQEEIKEAKAILRRSMMDSRREKLVQYKDFIKRMENPSPNGIAKLPISVLIADGKEIASNLREILELKDREAQLLALRQTVKPYLQLVDEQRDIYTGHKLNDIWRYFRLTWSNPAETTPGRTLLYLIRDAARPYHPVMGIASLENCPVQITCRDDYIGWTVKSFTQELYSYKSIDTVRNAFERLLFYIDDAIKDINFNDLCSLEDVENPSSRIIDKLTGIAIRSNAEREKALRNNIEKVDSDRSELGKISLSAEQALYKRKRAEQLARLLRAKILLRNLIKSSDFESKWLEFVESEIGQFAIRVALWSVKNKHIGTSMLELNVCGAVPPYNEILAGKLVAMVALSPKVVSDYNRKYRKRPSEIASRLKGEHVVRPADLVFVGTTSLYHVGSSQYNRVKLPGGLLKQGVKEVRWEQLGETIGYGTMHISKITMQCIQEIIEKDGYSEVNHVFGEGASPKLRAIGLGVSKLFEEGHISESRNFAKHYMSRLVYGAWLASNGKAYLTGQAERPNYFFDESKDPEEQTEQIIEYWRQRWLLSRIRFDKALDRMYAFDKSTLLVSNDLPTNDRIKFNLIKEEYSVPQTVTSSNNYVKLRDFIRKLYLDSSAYADYIDIDLLKAIHVETKLDSAVIEALRNKKSVILTGNPGDGKTHILRMIEGTIRDLHIECEIERDASRLKDEELFKKWKKSVENEKPFIAAINEAVLFNLAEDERFANFQPLKEAKHQVENAVLYSDKDEVESSVIVFDLSLRNVLSKEVVDSVINKLTDPLILGACKECAAYESCDFNRNIKLLRMKLFKNRLQKILDRVSSRGYHATLREVQAFISYLLFGGRTCEELMNSSGDTSYAVPQLIFSGKGSLFTEISQAFDPINVSHPIWDDKLINGRTSSEDWIIDYDSENNALEPNNIERFNARKRAFYFFHTHGDSLLDLVDDDESQFAEFLNLQERDALRIIIRRINSFFGDHRTSDELKVWQSHRYGLTPRRILYSMFSCKRREFEIVVPRLSKKMKSAFDLSKDHVLMRLRSHHSARIKIDFPMFQLLAHAERGLPVMFVESDVTRRLWQFMEQLSHVDNSESYSEVKLDLYDPLSSEYLAVTIDTEQRQYVDIYLGGTS